MGNHLDEEGAIGRYWLTRAMDDLGKRDPVDAYNDVLRLPEACKRD